MGRNIKRGAESWEEHKKGSRKLGRNIKRGPESLEDR